MRLEEILGLVMGFMLFSLMFYAAHRIGHTDFSKDLK